MKTTKSAHIETLPINTENVKPKLSTLDRIRHESPILPMIAESAKKNPILLHIEKLYEQKALLLHKVGQIEIELMEIEKAARLANRDLNDE